MIQKASAEAKADRFAQAARLARVNRMVWAARYATFLLPVLFLIPHLGAFAFQPANPYSDMLVSHYPNAVYLQNTLLEWRTVPLWSPTILSGYPFAANPLSGLFYLPGLLALLFPLPLGLNLLALLHLIFGGIGMYRFLRAEGLAEGAALLGGLAFEALPKLSAHLGAGHLTLIYAVAWTPWLLLAERRADGLGRLRLILPGALLGMIALADVRWTAYAGLLWLLYSLRRQCSIGGVRQFLKGSHPPAFSAAGLRALARSAWVRWLAGCGVNVGFAVLLAAPLLLPLAEYTALSTRSLLTAAESLTLSLPPGQLLDLIYPILGGSAEWTLYPGALLFALVLYALGMPLLRRRTGFWLAAAGVSLLFALGDAIPGLDLLFRLPGLDLLRVPPRALLITGFALCVVAAYALDSLYGAIADREWLPRDRSGLLLFAVTAFALLLGIAAWVVVKDDRARIQFMWGGLFLLLGTVLIFMARARRLSGAALTVLFLSAALVDLISVNRLSLDFRSPEQVFATGQILANYLAGQTDSQPYRVYSPSYSLPQHVAAASGLELADGIDPLQLRAYVDVMAAATGVPADGYSVTLPPFASGSPELDNLAYVPDASRLGRLNIRYVLADYALPGSGLTLLARLGETRIYENSLVLPRAWVQPEGAPVGEHIQSTPWVYQSPNRVLVKASGPGLLVLSEIAYPGWRVTVDGRAAPIQTAAGLLRAVTLESGEHTVQFDFVPGTVYAGLALGGLAWLILILAVWLERHPHG